MEHLPCHVLNTILKKAGHDARATSMVLSKTMYAAASHPSVWETIHIYRPSHAAAEFLRRPGVRARKVCVGPSSSMDVVWMMNAMIPLPTVTSLSITTHGRHIPASFLVPLAGMAGLQDLRIEFQGGTNMVTLEAPALPSIRHIHIVQPAPITVSYRFGLQELSCLETVHIHAMRCDLLRNVAPKLRRLVMRSPKETLRQLKLEAGGSLEVVELDVHATLCFQRLMRQLRKQKRIGLLLLHCSTDVHVDIPLPGLQRLHLLLSLPATAVDLEYTAVAGSTNITEVDVKVDEELLYGLTTVRLVGVPSVPEGIALFHEKHMHLGRCTMLEVCPDV